MILSHFSVVHGVLQESQKQYDFCDLIVGNVPGARAADDPEPSWQDHVQEACAVATGIQAKKAGERILLKVPSTNESPVVDREKLKHWSRLRSFLL